MSIPTVVLGGAGYVGGELLRLIHGHPDFELAAALSGTYAGQPVGAVFPHLAQAYPGSRFDDTEDWTKKVSRGSDVAVFSAMPHGASASAIANTLQMANDLDLNVHVVDSSADFRFDDADTFRSVYGQEHAAPELLGDFVCAVPEHAAKPTTPHAGHPGCFATAALIASVPLVADGIVRDDVYLCGITGSTGSGRSVKPGTHHPERHSNLYAYNPLGHRHSPEVGNLIAAACGTKPRLHFVPHSGPFARGIHMTLQAPLARPIDADAIRELLGEYYSASPFVAVVDGMPRLKDVVASNRALLGVATDEHTVTVTCVIDNLVKGAAGGAMQWMNRLWSLPDGAGLEAAPPAWT